MSILLFVIVRLLDRLRQGLRLVIRVIRRSELIIIVSHANRLFLGYVSTGSSLGE